MARPDSPKLIYLDACILITYLEKELHSVISPLMKILLDGKYQAAISGWHYVEVLGKRRGELFDPEVEAAAMELIEQSGFLMIDIGPDVLIRARHYALHEGMRPGDAKHAAAAVAGECDVLMTADQGLQRRYGEPRFIDGLWIDEAYLPAAETGGIEGL